MTVHTGIYMETCGFECIHMLVVAITGFLCLQISKAVGATVIAVCRGAAKAEALKRLGADEVIDQSADSTPLRAQIKVSPLLTPSPEPNASSHMGGWQDDTSPLQRPGMCMFIMSLWHGLDILQVIGGSHCGRQQESCADCI